MIAETGWSSGGSDIGASIASPENQAKYFADFFQVARACNILFYWYTALDSKWRVTNGGKEVESDLGIPFTCIKEKNVIGQRNQWHVWNSDPTECLHNDR